MLNEVTQFFAHLDDIDCWVDSTGVEHFPFQNTPSEFLEFAQNDLKQKGPQATGNALSNAKRALDCQLDYFLITYGLSGISHTQTWSTGKKISLLGDLGIVPDSILHRVNRARNDFEHRYDMPSLVTAENSIDIVGLFVAATDLYLFPARYGTYFEVKDHSEPPPEQKPESKSLLSMLRDPLAFLHLDMLQGGAIGVNGKANGLSFDHQISSESNLNEYLYLLTYILHSHRINAPNPQRYFQKLRYAGSVSQNGG